MSGERMPLPQTDPCQGCGRCCQTIGMPPFEAVNPELGPKSIANPRLSDKERAMVEHDAALFEAMPTELRVSHAGALLALELDPSGRACVWYDASQQRCKHHEWRPLTCRQFEVQGPRCVILRLNPEAELHWESGASLAKWLDPRCEDDQR